MKWSDYVLKNKPEKIVSADIPAENVLSHVDIYYSPLDFTFYGIEFFNKQDESISKVASVPKTPSSAQVPYRV